MRADGLWHADLVRLLMDLRHHDAVVIADAGLPVAATVPTIDLGWRRGEPRVPDVLRAVIAELVVERVTLAKELRDGRRADYLDAALGRVPVDWVSHEDLKAIAGEARAVVRTGDDTPFANAVLHAGVPFGDDGGVPA
jgi:D-ribose pyranase